MAAICWFPLWLIEGVLSVGPHSMVSICPDEATLELYFIRLDYTSHVLIFCQGYKYIIQCVCLIEGSWLKGVYRFKKSPTALHCPEITSCTLLPWPWANHWFSSHIPACMVRDHWDQWLAAMSHKRCMWSSVGTDGGPSEQWWRGGMWVLFFYFGTIDSIRREFLKIFGKPL